MYHCHHNKWENVEVIIYISRSWHVLNFWLLSASTTSCLLRFLQEYKKRVQKFSFFFLSISNSSKFECECKLHSNEKSGGERKGINPRTITVIFFPKFFLLNDSCIREKKICARLTKNYAISRFQTAANFLNDFLLLSRVIGHRWPETKSFWLHAHKGKDRGGKTMSKFNGASKRYLWSQVRLNYKYTHSRNVTKKSLTFKHTQCLESSDEERSPGKIFASIEASESEMWTTRVSNVIRILNQNLSNETYAKSKNPNKKYQNLNFN